MSEPEYLVGYGRAGDFGRFRPAMPAEYQRGDRVVVRSHQGLEMGEVMCPAISGHTPFLGRTAVGELLRRVTPDDEQAFARLQRFGQDVFERGGQLLDELKLPLEILDVEVLLDERQAVVYYLRWQDCDYRPLVSTLARIFDLGIIMHDLALPGEQAEPEAAGCGKPDCGQGHGGCATCATGGGCSIGGCGKGARKEDVAAYLAGLHAHTAPAARMSLA
jgi:cell fate regulator YaaT (PSP1 superfamily)